MATPDRRESATLAGTTPAPATRAPASGVGTRRSPHLPSIEDQLFTEGYAFDFFQAVRLLERLDPERRPVGRSGPPGAETVRFLAHLSLAFPPSSIYDIERATAANRGPRMIVAFMGLTGPSGVLPRHYTELLLRLEMDAKGPEKRALRAWLDLFNHRFISLAYRAWEKYRFYIPYERGEAGRDEPDPFVNSLYCLVGMGPKALRNRLRVSVPEEVEGVPQERVLARIEDLALLHYSGFLAHRPRSAVALEAFLSDYFQLRVEVQQFQGQWLILDRANQSRMGMGRSNNQLGVSVVAGERVWDVQSKIRLRVGPLRYAEFTEFLPDRSPTAERKAFFLLGHVTRLYLGPEFDYEVQLVLKKEEVPRCQLTRGAAGPRLGWNTWVRTRDFPRDADEAVFEGEELVWADARP